MSTISAKKNEIERAWFVVEAENKGLSGWLQK